MMQPRIVPYAVLRNIALQAGFFFIFLLTVVPLSMASIDFF